jgi:hypothetical protein
MRFNEIINYAIDNHAYALLNEIIQGNVVPAFEQPCWDCGRLRYFWYDENGFGWFEQCIFKRIS